MRSLLSANNAAIQDASGLVTRDLLYIIARNRDTLAAQPVGFWSDDHDRTITVVDPDSTTGATVNRAYYGAGGLIEISDIPQVFHISTQHVTITMSQFHDLVEQAVRLYDCQQAKVQIHRLFLNRITRVPVAAAEVRWVGFIDNIEIITPEENSEGSITITCVSHTQEFLRNNPDTRSHESQLLRSSTDNFYQDTAVVGEWEFWWGAKSGKLETEKPKQAAEPFVIRGTQ